MNDLPEESKKIIYMCEDCKCKICIESFLNKSMSNCFNCIDCEEQNNHVEECSMFYKMNKII